MRGRGTKRAVAAPKFAGRRSKEERDKLEAELHAKKLEEAKAAHAAAKAAGRGRGRSDRGRGRGKARGGFMGERRMVDTVASGPLSAGTVAFDPTVGRRSAYGAGGGGGGGGGGGFGGFGGAGGGGSRIKREGGSSSLFIKQEDGGYISSDADEGEEGPKKDVDEINLISDEEDEGAAATSYQSFAPIRIGRVEHKERALAQPPENAKDAEDEEAGPNERRTSITKRTPSPTATRKGKQKAKEVEVVRTERKWKGAWGTSSDSEGEINIKEEPNDDATMDVPEAEQAVQDAEMEDAAQKAAEAAAMEQISSPESKRKTRARIKKSEQVPEHQTQEERKEYERHLMDLDILRAELGEIAIAPPAAPATPAQPATEGENDGDKSDGEKADGEKTDGDTTMQDAPQETPQDAAAALDKRADRVYLFQFPPVLPDLSADKVKKEPQSPELARRDKSGGPPIDLDAIPEHKETKVGGSAANAFGVDDDDAPTGQAQLASGAVGKLRIHASGRATLDWGGTSLELGMGTDVQFLQDVVVARINDENKEGDDPVGGQAMGLGQVRGKFVVTPDWQEIVG